MLKLSDDTQCVSYEYPDSSGEIQVINPMIDQSVEPIQKRLTIESNRYNAIDKQLINLKNAIGNPSTQEQLINRVNSIDDRITQLIECGDTIMSTLHQLQDSYNLYPQYQEYELVERMINNLNKQSVQLSVLRDRIQFVLVTEYDCQVRYRIFWKRKSERKERMKRCDLIKSACNQYLNQRTQVSEVKRLIRSCQLMSGELTLEMELDQRLTRIEEQLRQRGCGCSYRNQCC